MEPIHVTDYGFLWGLVVLAVALIALGLACGWYVRGAYMEQYIKQQLRARMDRLRYPGMAALIGGGYQPEVQGDSEIAAPVIGGSAVRSPNIPPCSIPGCERPLYKWGFGHGGIWVRCQEHFEEEE